MAPIPLAMAPPALLLKMLAIAATGARRRPGSAASSIAPATAKITPYFSALLKTCVAWKPLRSKPFSSGCCDSSLSSYPSSELIQSTYYYILYNLTNELNVRLYVMVRSILPDNNLFKVSAIYRNSMHRTASRAGILSRPVISNDDKTTQFTTERATVN